MFRLIAAIARQQQAACCVQFVEALLPNTSREEDLALKLVVSMTCKDFIVEQFETDFCLIVCVCCRKNC